jgi:hypothetical protein
MNMADHAHAADNLPAPEMDYPAHERTYEMFLKLAKWGTIHVIVILVLMAYFLL